MADPVYPDVSTWIPDIDKWALIAEGIKDVALGALALFPTGDVAPAPVTRAQRYPSAYVAHGPQPTVEAQQKLRQLVVAFQYGYLGQAGEENYQNLKGAIGIAGFQTARFVLQLAAPNVMPTGGLSPLPARSDRQQSVETDFLTDAYIVWSSMVALMLGGITPRPWPTATERGDQMMVGPLEAIDSAGNVIAYRIQVQVQAS